MDLRGVFDDLVRLETVLWNGVDARLRQECGLPLGSLDLLRVIERTPHCRVFDIASALAITVGGTSQAVDRLEKRGLCVRRPNPADRRSSVLELTAEARDLIRTAVEVFDRELEAYLRTPLPAADLGRFAAALSTLRAAAADRGGPVSEPN